MIRCVENGRTRMAIRAKLVWLKFGALAILAGLLNKTGLVVPCNQTGRAGHLTALVKLNIDKPAGLSIRTSLVKQSNRTGSVCRYSQTDLAKDTRVRLDKTVVFNQTGGVKRASHCLVYLWWGFVTSGFVRRSGKTVSFGRPLYVW